MSPEVTIASNCERPIRQTGWGLYHYFMVGMASACAFSQATASNSIPFAIPLAVCDISVSEKMINIVDVCFSFGTAIGGFFLTSISDITGKKCMVPVTLMIIFGSTFAIGFAHGSVMIVACAFILGSGLVANANCMKIHLAEILPAEKRGSALVFPDMFWGAGYIISATVAWLLTPSIIHNQSKDMRLATWRLMFGLSGAFSVMVACASALIQPSPRFLLFTRKYPQALDTLKQIYAINNSKHCDTYSMHQEDLNQCVDNFNLNDEAHPINCTEQTLSILRRIQKLVSQLFKKRFVGITTLIIFLKFAVILGLPATNIWLAKMLKYSNKDDCYINAGDILHMEEDATKCEFVLSPSLYKNFFLIALNIIFGQVVLLLIIDRIGRRISISIYNLDGTTMLTFPTCIIALKRIPRINIFMAKFSVAGCVACGVSSFALGYVHNIYAVQLLTSSVFMMAYSLVDSALNIVVIEAYPTAFRGTAAGGTQFFARFASGFVKRFLQTPCQYSFIFMGALMLAAAVLCYFLPELRGQAMVE